MPSRVKNLLEDLRVEKEKNKRLKLQVQAAEAAAKSSQQQMIRLDNTIKELKLQQQNQKAYSQKNKQQERLTEAAEKIDELIQANTHLNQAKESAVKLSGKQRKQYARQMAALHHRIDFLTKILEEHGIEIQ